MGHKGVSKRKAPKPKKPAISSMNPTGAVSSLARASESPATVSLGKGEAISIRKGSKKK